MPAAVVGGDVNNVSSFYAGRPTVFNQLKPMRNEMVNSFVMRGANLNQRHTDVFNMVHSNSVDRQSASFATPHVSHNNSSMLKIRVGKPPLHHRTNSRNLDNRDSVAELTPAPYEPS